MRAAIAITASILLALGTATATARARGTFQKGVMSYAVSGSWTTTNTVRSECEVATGPGTVDTRNFSYPVIEKGTFSSTMGRAGYQGDVGREPFFLGVGDRVAKLKVSVTRTATKPVACTGEPKTDCGTRTLKGAARPEFEGSFRGGAIDLHLSFANTRSSYDLTDPFKTCGSDATSLFLNRVSGSRARPDYQDEALRYPTNRGFWARKRRTLTGTVHGKGVVFKLALKLSRRTLSSKRDLHP